MDYVTALGNLPKENEFFVGIDSDGCVFDSMEIKQQECFCPNFIKHYSLQAASKYAREVWLFVNLYSKTRGCNRYLAVQRALELIRERPEFAARGLDVKSIPSLDAWIEEEPKRGIPTLTAKVEASGDEALKAVLAWAVEVDERIKDIVKGVPPFPGVRESFAKLRGQADMIVVSQTPVEALEREWAEHGIDCFVNFIAGQEAGTKTQHLEYAAGPDKYDRNKVLMIGDAPGDLKAAKANNALFYPILPGSEEDSWARFHQDAIDKFLAGEYAGEYEAMLLGEFDKALPEAPPWN
ncbi:MAG: HAD family hydrolase [Lentisphaeria bacterium]|nr:HAD family hydrolase [Lentisphaeria bacterium]